MTRLEQVLSVADTATIRFGTHDIYVTKPPTRQPHAGWTITVVDVAALPASDGSRPTHKVVAPTWPVVLARLSFIGVSLDAAWQVGWPEGERVDEAAPTRPLPAIRQGA
jgi:hypothetical protein